MPSVLEHPVHQEIPAGSSAPCEGFIYEIALKTPPSNLWLKELSNTHRLLQTWFSGQSEGLYRLLDFVIHPDGFLLRTKWKKEMALESFLGFVRKKSTPSHQTMEESWIAEPVLLSKAAVLQPEAKQLPLDLSRISLLHDSRS